MEGDVVSKRRYIIMKPLSVHLSFHRYIVAIQKEADQAEHVCAIGTDMGGLKAFKHIEPGMAEGVVPPDRNRSKPRVYRVQ
jgi:hypothetical protein